jgi:hypothetical protein
MALRWSAISVETFEALKIGHSRKQKSPQADGENQVAIKRMLKPDSEKRARFDEPASEDQSADEAERHSLPMNGRAARGKENGVHGCEKHPLTALASRPAPFSADA